MHQAALRKKPEDFTGILKEIVELCKMVGANMNDVCIDETFERKSSASLNLDQSLLQGSDTSQSTG